MSSTSRDALAAEARVDVFIDGEPAGADVHRDGRQTRWDAHRSARRQELTRAARRAVHHGGPDLSMEQIAAAAGTSKPIVYRYFRDKSGLQLAVGRLVLADVREALATAVASSRRPHEQLAAMVGAYIDLVESSPHVYAFVVSGGVEATGQVRGFVAEVEELVARTLLPVLRPAVPADPADLALARTWAAGGVGLVRRAVEFWIAERQAHCGDAADGGVAGSRDAGAALTRDELTAHITDWLWEGASGVARRTAHRSLKSPFTDGPVRR